MHSECTTYFQYWYKGIVIGIDIEIRRVLASNWNCNVDLADHILCVKNRNKILCVNKIRAKMTFYSDRDFLVELEPPDYEYKAFQNLFIDSGANNINGREQ